VYSYGRLRYRIPRALDALAGRLSAHMHLLNSQDAANLLWAFPQLRHPPPAAFLNQLPLVMVERLSEFKPQVSCCGVSRGWVWAGERGAAGTAASTSRMLGRVSSGWV
jgi:hypothetical protein